jgi:mannan endo-1,4-beta-mannosidase
MRQAGYVVPLMIDAPDYGTSLEVFVSHGAELVAADPLGNILLSCHAYWAEYDGVTQFNALTAPRLPIVFGEIANKQDDTDGAGNLIGYYDLDGSGQNVKPDTGFTYQSFLPLLSQRGYGWLAWSWGPDNCAARMLTTDGTSFASITPYGQDIVNRLSGVSKIST